VRKDLGRELDAPRGRDRALAEQTQDRIVVGGLTMGMTNSWFFAAERSMDGPPMSMLSSASSRLTPGWATVIWNVYRFTATRSIGAIPSASSDARWAGRSRRASSPPWISGCSVLSRPSSTSGKPVTSSTPITGTPAARNAAAVPPVETMSQPSAERPCAKPTMPRLSLTEISARGMPSLSP